MLGLGSWQIYGYGFLKVVLWIHVQYFSSGPLEEDFQVKFVMHCLQTGHLSADFVSLDYLCTVGKGIFLLLCHWMLFLILLLSVWVVPL